jgi:hypothetical protein
MGNVGGACVGPPLAPLRADRPASDQDGPIEGDEPGEIEPPQPAGFERRVRRPAGRGTPGTGPAPANSAMADALRALKR